MVVVIAPGRPGVNADFLHRSRPFGVLHNNLTVNALIANIISPSTVTLLTGMRSGRGKDA